jgi:hypothetical protein
MPVTAGILDIIGGIFQLFLLLYLLLFGFALGLSWEVIILALFLAVTGILAIVGGVTALRRRRWRLALDTSILAFFPTMLWPYIFIWGQYASTPTAQLQAIPLLLGVCTIALTALSRKQFERK